MKNKMIMSIIPIVLLSGCMSTNGEIMGEMYNKVSVNYSKFDNTKNITTSNMICLDSIQIRLSQNTSQRKDDIIILSAGTTTPNNIDGGYSLKFNVDGETFLFEPISTITNYDDINYRYGVTGKFYNKSYRVTSSFINKVILAKSVMVRVNLLNSRYIDAICTPVTPKDYFYLTGITISKKQLIDINANLAQKGFSKFNSLSKEL